MFFRDLKALFYFFILIVYVNMLFLIHNIETDFTVEEKDESIEPKLNNTMYNNTANITEINIEEVYETILNKIRDRVEWELRGYNWSKSGFQFEELVPEKGGRQQKTIIISPWRSGATYLGSLFGALPGVLYFYKPLEHIQGRLYVNFDVPVNQKLSAESVKALLSCKVVNVSYVDYFDKYSVPKFYYDNRMWTYCRLDNKACLDLEFRKRVCELFPFLVVKDVNVRLQYVEELLTDEEPNVKVVVLIRDPRAIIRSRLTHECKPSTNCVSVESVCEELVADHVAARRLLLKYPRRITILRFEELALNTVGTVHNLLRFLNMDMMEAAEEFFQMQKALSNNTDCWLPEGEAFDWKGSMDYKLVKDIQDTDICKEAMDVWGYKPATSWTHQTSNGFIPISNYEIKERSDTVTTSHVHREVRLL